MKHGVWYGKQAEALLLWSRVAVFSLSSAGFVYQAGISILATLATRMEILLITTLILCPYGTAAHPAGNGSRWLGWTDLQVRSLWDQLAVGG